MSRPKNRPLANIDWKVVDKMLEAHCTGTEVASKLGIHEDTLYTRVAKVFGMTFSAYSQQKKANGKSNLKFSQYKNALEGNTSIQIWLGKNWLGQKDEPKVEKDFDGNLAILLEMLQKIQKPEDFKNNDSSKKT